MIRRAVAVALLVPAVAGAQGLDRRIADAAAGQPAWVAYRVPLAGGRSQTRPLSVCCDDTFHGSCRLDGPDGITMSDGTRGSSRRIPIEPSSELLVFAHAEGGAVDRLRLFTPDCALDTTGLRLVWLQGVTPDDSAAWLAGLAAASDPGDHGRRPGDAALAALSLQAGDRASEALVSLARGSGPAHLRGQALFWLAQRAGSRAAAAITDAIANDPDTAVKKRAVFALSQLPKDEGVPLLIQVARTNRNPAVRRQAMFWLGESKDPRAVSFFEEILKR